MKPKIEFRETILKIIQGVNAESQESVASAIIDAYMAGVEHGARLMVKYSKDVVTHELGQLQQALDIKK